MSFAPNYVPIVGFATEESTSVAGRSTVRTVAVDTELANISTSINALNTNLKAIQRDDGKLKDGLIEPYALSEQSRALIASGGRPRGEWQPDTDYILGDAIQYLNIARLSLSNHNSGSTFNSGLWLEISGDGTSSTNAANAAASALSALTSASNALISENNADISEANALASKNSAAQSAIDAANAIAGNIVTGNLIGSINLKRTTVAATATTTPLWTTSNGNVQDWTGNPTIIALPAAPQAGSQRIVYPAPGTVMTHGGNISVQGNASYTVQAGDELTITAITTTTFYMKINRKDGIAISTNPVSKNIIINGGFTINQRGYVSAAVLTAGSYGHDRWKAGASGGDYSFTQLASNTQITIAANKTLIQVIEDKNIQDTNYVLSWTGTAQARVGLNGAAPSGSYSSSPLIITGQTAGSSLSVEFGNGASTGTLSKVQLEFGATAGTMERRLYQDELEFCQRYCQVAPINSLKATSVLSAAGWVLSTSWSMVTTMRATPTSNTPTWGLTLLNTPTLTLDAGSIYAVATSTTNGTCAFNNSSAIILSAEL